MSGAHLRALGDPAPAHQRWVDVVERHLSRYGGNTRAGYRSDLAKWAEWCAVRGVDPLGATDELVHAFLENCRAPATRARRLASLASLFRTAVELRQMDIDDVPNVSIHRPPRARRRQTLSWEQLEQIEAYARTVGAKELCMIQLLGRARLRPSEVCALRVEDLDLAALEYSVQTPAGRGPRHGTFKLDRTTASTLLELIGGRRVGPVVVGDTMAPLNRQQLWRVVCRIAREAGLPLVTADDLRTSGQRR